MSVTQDEQRRFIPMDKPLAKCEVWHDPPLVLPKGKKRKPIETFYTPLIDEEHTQAMLLRVLPHITKLVQQGGYMLTLHGEPITLKDRIHVGT